MIDWVRIDGTAIPSGQATAAGALGPAGLGIGTLTSVVAGNQQNTISGTEVSGATQYDLYWNTAGSVAKTDNKIADITFPHVHSGLSNGTTYYYAYAVTDGETESNLSNELSGTPNTNPPLTTKVLMFSVK